MSFHVLPYEAIELQNQLDGIGTRLDGVDKNLLEIRDSLVEMTSTLKIVADAFLKSRSRVVEEDTSEPDDD